ncbi:GH3 auxin-responsive promoter family protein [Candidatus Bathyarchaeota archaeon]|nr:GH3 auxin-responsive promoter family protein [Candidatus Bathyarchaeota archaeon]
MKGIDLWKKYCSFYEKDFSEHVEYSKTRMKRYFEKWRRTDLAKILCQKRPRDFREVPPTRYDDYPMLKEFGQKVLEASKKTPRKPGELFKEYYDRISRKFGLALNKYMTEPFYLCMRTTGTTGSGKWIVHGETFWKNFVESSVAVAILSASDSWGETKVRAGDKALNLCSPIPLISGWGAWATKTVFKLVPPIEVADNLDVKEKFNFLLKVIEKGEKISLGGGIGSLFYMICKYFLDPEEFYREYYYSLGPGLKKILLYLKIFECRLSGKKKKRITDILPLKGVLVAGAESKLYLEFFKEELGLEPLHIYGSTEAGPIMRGDPDRKTDLIPDLRTCYLEFQTESGEVKEIDELKKGEVYNVTVTTYGSILFRYVMDDLVRLVDFRDDGMPVFSFEGRKKTVLKLYGRYVITPRVIVDALYDAGLRSSDKWAVTKIMKPKERLCFLMEKTWPYSEREAEKIIFKSLMKIDETIPQRGDTLKNFLSDFRIKDPSEVVKVTYLKPGAFLRYSMIKAKEGAPIGQYKPPKIIPPERHDIYETLINA